MLQARDLWLTVPARSGPVNVRDRQAGPAMLDIVRRRLAGSRGRRFARHRRTVRFGQDQPVDAAGRAGAAVAGQRAHRRHRSRGPHRGPARPVPWPQHRHRVPVLPPDPDDDRAGERRHPAGADRAVRRGPGSRPTRWTRSGCRTASTTVRASSPAASSSAWHWPAPSHPGRACCWRTSRPAISTSPPAARVADLMFALQRERGTTLVLITHDATLAARCDRVLTVSDGRLSETGQLSEPVR